MCGVSIPLEQGGVFRPVKEIAPKHRCHVSIPLEQGGVFRRILRVQDDDSAASQSL